MTRSRPCTTCSRPSTASATRQENGDQLRALLAIAEEQLDLLEADIERLYDDWFIETCQEWVVPYIGDLLGVRGLVEVEGAPFSQRGLVANTIAYRRAKGTVAVLEQLARDVTGWGARAVEYFELLATTRSMNHRRRSDVAIADVRSADAAALTGTPFERAAAPRRRAPHRQRPRPLQHPARRPARVAPAELSARRPRHRPARRRRHARRGRPLHVQPARLRPPAVQRAARRGGARPTSPPSPTWPRRCAAARSTTSSRRCAGPPSGRRPRHAARDRTGVHRGLLRRQPAGLARRPIRGRRVRTQEVQPEADRDLRPQRSGRSAGDRLAASACARPGAPDDVETSTRASASIPSRPARVREPPTRVEVGYAYGFPGDLGGGPYDRTRLGRAGCSPTCRTPTGRASAGRRAVTAVAGGRRSDLVPTLAAAVDAVERPARAQRRRAGVGVIAVMDSRTYDDDLTIEVPAGSRAA